MLVFSHTLMVLERVLLVVQVKVIVVHPTFRSIPAESQLSCAVGKQVKALHRSGTVEDPT